MVKRHTEKERYKIHGKGTNMERRQIQKRNYIKKRFHGDTERRYTGKKNIIYGRY